MRGLAVSFLVLTATTSSSTGLEERALPGNSTLTVSRSVHDGLPALRIVDKPDAGGDPLVLLPVRGFKNGVIEADVAGRRSAEAPPDMRGFIGLAFRVQDGRYEAFYIRPANGRANDQLRRNHSTQYISMPDFPWQRLRSETPGVYESYADMEEGQWTRLRVEVDGRTARLFVGGAKQPSLIVNDLKLGADAEGGVALWVGPGTEGYFRNVTVTR